MTNDPTTLPDWAVSVLERRVQWLAKQEETEGYRFHPSQERKAIEILLATVSELQRKIAMQSMSLAQMHDGARLAARKVRASKAREELLYWACRDAGLATPELPGLDDIEEGQRGELLAPG